jgi:ribosomal protein S18 acetylase RimI-like enzyme
MASDEAITIRVGTSADGETFLALLNAAELSRAGGSHSPSADPGRVRQRITAPDAFFLVAESWEGGEPVGVAAGTQGREDEGGGPEIPGLCHITMVAVHPAFWGRGIGTEVVRALISEIRARGYDRAQLFTQADNARAQRLYAGLGFRRTGATAVSTGGEGIVQYLLSPLP